MSMSAADLQALRPDQTIDVKGEVCPYPQIAARRGLQKLAAGQVLALETDHTISTETVPNMVQNEGLAEVLGILPAARGVWRIYLRRT